MTHPRNAQAVELVTETGYNVEQSYTASKNEQVVELSGDFDIKDLKLQLETIESEDGSEGVMGVSIKRSNAPLPTLKMFTLSFARAVDTVLQPEKAAPRKRRTPTSRCCRVFALASRRR